MSNLIVLNLGHGDSDRGCPAITVQLWEADNTAPMQILGSLPPAPQLATIYDRWQHFYAALYAHCGWRRSPSSASSNNFELDDDTHYIQDVSEPEFKLLCHQLQQQLNTWLNAESFRSIDRQLRTRFNLDQDLCVIITASDRALLRLPWHLWQLFEDYPRAELALSLPEYTRSLKVGLSPAKNAVHILGILGSRTGIDIDTDQQLLQQLPQTQLHLLVEPDLETLNQQLWQSSWDLLFFAGHSSSQGRGEIQISPTVSLTLDQLRYGLKKAIERGLQLAIFNSCDGLELAWDLADLQIPQVIVMREPVPDRVAQEFLKYFLAAFSSGQSLYLAVREARERLQSLETEFPCATWLPVICQNPAEVPTTWQALQGNPEALHPLALPHSPLFPTRLLHGLLCSVVITGLTLGARSLGMLQPLELWAFDRGLTLRAEEPPDNRFLIITIDEADIQAQNPKDLRGSLSDSAFDQLLQILNRHQPSVIGLDLYRDFPTSANYPKLVQQLRQNERLLVTCKSSDPSVDPTGIAPPPEVSLNRIGFSDFLSDDDGILRRQLISFNPDPASPCGTSSSLSAQLAAKYLKLQGINADYHPTRAPYLGTLKLSPLTAQTGGYQRIDASGTQILLNYRSPPSIMGAPRSLLDTIPRVSLTHALSGTIQPDLIRDRIILIGTIASSGGDLWSTPYGSGSAEQVPGVFLQAQMTSQLLSAALEGRPLLTAWSLTGDALWIWGWSLVGGVIVLLPLQSFKRSLPGHLRPVWVQLGVLPLIAIGGLGGSCLVLLGQGVWVPLIPAAIAGVLTGCTVYLASSSRYE